MSDAATATKLMTTPPPYTIDVQFCRYLGWQSVVEILHHPLHLLRELLCLQIDPSASRVVRTPKRCDGNLRSGEHTLHTPRHFESQYLLTFCKIHTETGRSRREARARERASVSRGRPVGTVCVFTPELQWQSRGQRRI